MKIVGLQKVSTIDYPGEICCVIFLHGCNFRCGFCYNPELVVRKYDGGFSEKYVLDFLKSRVGKLDGVCISGGEPLMSLDTPSGHENLRTGFDFVRKIKEMGFRIKIDTNGSFSSRLREMIDLGLVDYVAMDVKGCRKDYSKIVGVDVDLSSVERSMKLVYDFGLGGRDYEFRTTVVGRLHSKESIVEMAKWMNEVCGGKPRRIFLQGFKNKGEMVGADFENEKDVSESFLGELAKDVAGFFEEVGIRV